MKQSDLSPGKGGELGCRVLPCWELGSLCASVSPVEWMVLASLADGPNPGLLPVRAPLQSCRVYLVSSCLRGHLGSRSEKHHSAASCPQLLAGAGCSLYPGAQALLPSPHPMGEGSSLQHPSTKPKPLGASFLLLHGAGAVGLSADLSLTGGAELSLAEPSTSQEAPGWLVALLPPRLTSWLVAGCPAPTGQPYTPVSGTAKPGALGLIYTLLSA